jgi:hypothetical protein
VTPLDVEKLSKEYHAARPHHFFSVDGFLKPDFAREVSAAFPGFEEARRLGRHFHWVNEGVKVQITERDRFPEAVRRLHEIIASPELMEVVSRVTGIPALVADPGLAGGGMHLMGPQGHLDPHVDFNMLEAEELHRRLNILVYLTPGWQEAWEGRFDLWDVDVKERQVTIAPLFNRCVVFNTTETSFHGVTPVRCSPGITRNSFAAYYYTKEPPPEWTGSFHNTIYRTRPGEWFKGSVRMPLERAQRRSAWLARSLYLALRKRVERILPS